MPNKPELKIRVTEYLDLNVDTEQWTCNRCGCSLGPARENYKKSCLLYDRDPREIHIPIVKGDYSFAPDPMWVRIIEFYCPGCGTQIETEYLPPGHPITHDIEIDIDALKEKLSRNEIAIKDERIESVE
jgi:acetone carboxylase gamma subunit